MRHIKISPKNSCFPLIIGESVEENANLVIRLLIRRPECLGPALRGEGEGLLSAVMSANAMSEQIARIVESGECTHIYSRQIGLIMRKLKTKKRENINVAKRLSWKRYKYCFFLAKKSH